MAPFTWTLFFACLGLKVSQTEAPSWTIKMPSSVKGLPGSCVVIPCSFEYPDPGKEVTQFIGMWLDASHQLIYHPEKSKITQQYGNRTELLGNVSKKICTLKIDPLKQGDQGPFHFRIVMPDYEKFSYQENTVSITMMSELNPIQFSVKEHVTEGQNVSASCSVSHSCRTSPPVFTWSHSGKEHVQQQEMNDGQTSETSTLKFHPTSADHNKPLQCTVTYKGGQHHKTSRILKVNHAPVNVKVEHKSEVKEGEAVPLRCSCDAYPAANIYWWHNEMGALLHQGNDFTLPNVSRHMGALYCNASNTIGSGKSNPVQFNVLYAPAIAKASSCTSEGNMVKCVCISDSKPPSKLYFVLHDRILPNTKVEKHGSVTIGTLIAELGSTVVVYCLANNTMGSANLTLSSPVSSKMLNLYIIIASLAGGILVMILITVKVVKKWGKYEDTSAPHISSTKEDKDVTLPQYTTTKRKKRYDDVNCSDIHANDHVYGNMENDCDDAIYANM
ncbi:hypothetical protein PBY51_017874 [Eleginops maclovinus]|uniref:Ig-like domain-containing protein n=1 Tax=Eleginops maclovinus TaxID=56733 RepID=A0AAN8AJQ0_ELEMC|nr:hypothetical protein PBY51_017874 [Eleginops maclovinus]